MRETLSRLSEELPGLMIYEVPTGTAAFDWTVPDEWTIRDAYIEDSAARRIVDFKVNNIGVLGYSEPVNKWLELDELKPHLYTLPDQPDAIPYVTSYYKRRWGFCLSENQLASLAPGQYHAVIDADLKPGVLNYAELIIRGESDKEVFLSTYVCHPSMANNELSGPVVTTALAKWLMGAPRKHTFRIVFIPETIGSIIYLSRNLSEMKSRTVAGFNVSCIGDDRCYSYLPSRAGNTKSDVVAKHVLHHIDAGYKSYSWLDRGSDERQYCSPGADLPIATIMRSKYGAYPEYHTSLDTLGGVVTASGLSGGYCALQKAISIIENDYTPMVVTIGEPQLGKRGLYPDLSKVGSSSGIRTMMDAISYCDGTMSLLEIADVLNVPFDLLFETCEPLVSAGLITKV